ncbi:imidazolonepropionase [Peptoniphilus asaccharolyticus DSM 20463]|uniref:Imidazolonepropionase n=1 Tax=Peptoniphilus asaccharolyticus DSM 20463 TaxID=573058 RepID=A0A1W1V952_PEPAS|nr:imidazolonepropionase [Peptoniphilus asaccharolyticus]MBL7575812.1 imidazolonepropionase [Peptoniphilus asaccharolyticus]SMB89793.1 imidazolonepropionase [Peptoniphilus asaccharolyticus DSM 20463]
MKNLLLKDCKSILTIREDADDLIGIISNKSILIEDERIKRIADYSKLDVDSKIEVIDCSNKIVMPGYVDSHTHLIFGKSRVDEYAASLTMSAEDVKKAVGLVGLASSMYSTKNATDEELLQTSLKKLNRMLKTGTTTVEIKSGYGIDKENELRQLRIIKEIKKHTPQTILSTYLGAHYFDVEMGKENYIQYMIDEVMPVVKEENLAEFCDVWCDDGYYTAEDSRKILSAGLEFGMLPTLHTECYSAIGGARVGAELKAANVGHLNYLEDEDIDVLRDNGVVGILIPGTDFSVKHHRPFNPRPMIDKGLTIAIATNLNPGNWIESMPLAMAMACRNHGMTPEEAIRAATLGGAKALKIEKDYGSIEEGKFADIQILESDSYKNCIYKIGVNEVDKVIKKGKIVFEN